MKYYRNLKYMCAAVTVAASSFAASATTVTFVKLTGLTGTAPNDQTAVYRADLSGLSGTVAAISIQDGSSTSAGSPGQFSGFDLDAIKLSSTNCATATCAATASGLNVFNFSSGIVFSPGAQTAPTDPKLFGTGPTGNTVNNSIATLGLFDGVSSTAVPNGFVSLGINGSIAFNLTSNVSGSGLYLYIGEVGDNGEVANSNVSVLSTPVPQVPEPASWAMFIGGFGLVGGAMRRRRAIVSFT